MDFKKIKKLVSLVETSDISSLCVEENNLKIEIKRELGTAPPAAQVQPKIQIEAPAPVENQPEKASDLIEIKSPMVGTFYTSPNPESPPFVSKGSRITSGEIVCIIEAMKLFNEIESDISGTIEKVCVENGAPVEFNQPLFLVKKH
jgi:acetyl-CoA carboxylase biotin carboxyl carrier protein